MNYNVSSPGTALLCIIICVSFPEKYIVCVFVLPNVFVLTCMLCLWLLWFPSCAFSQKGLSLKKCVCDYFPNSSIHSCSRLVSTHFHLPFLCPQEGDETDTKLVLWMIIHLLRWLSNHVECDYSPHVSLGLRLPKACWHLFELTPHKLHICAHPLAVPAHFKFYTSSNPPCK